MENFNDNNTCNENKNEVKNSGNAKNDGIKGRKRFTIEKYKAFMDKYGFYVVLFMCICIIGATALLTSDQPMPWDKDSGKGNINQQEQISESDKDDILINVKDKTENSDSSADKASDSPDGNTKDSSGASGNSKDNKDNTDNKGDGKNTGKTEDKGSTTNKGDSQSKDDANDKDAENDKKDAANDKNDANGKSDAGGNNDETALPVDAPDSSSDMLMPAEGEIIKPYSMEKLVFSNTLKEWTVHTGVDIKAGLGDEVKAAGDGTVESVVEDNLMGIIITIDHGKGLKTVYSGVSTDGMVTIGQEVKKGQVISGVGKTAIMEIADGPHLHFEVLLDGEPVDPMVYIDAESQF